MVWNRTKFHRFINRLIGNQKAFPMGQNIEDLMHKKCVQIKIWENFILSNKKTIFYLENTFYAILYYKHYKILATAFEFVIKCNSYCFQQNQLNWAYIFSAMFFTNFPANCTSIHACLSHSTFQLRIPLHTSAHRVHMNYQCLLPLLKLTYCLCTNCMDGSYRIIPVEM